MPGRTGSYGLCGGGHRHRCWKQASPRGTCQRSRSRRRTERGGRRRTGPGPRRLDRGRSASCGPAGASACPRLSKEAESPSRVPSILGWRCRHGGRAAHCSADGAQSLSQGKNSVGISKRDPRRPQTERLPPVFESTRRPQSSLLRVRVLYVRHFPLVAGRFGSCHGDGAGGQSPVGRVVLFTLTSTTHRTRRVVADQMILPCSAATRLAPSSWRMAPPL